MWVFLLLPLLAFPVAGTPGAATLLTGLVAVPVFAVSALLAGDLVQILYGTQWRAAGPVLAWLLAFMPALAIWGISTPVLWNTGRRQHEWALQLPLIALGAIMIGAVAPWGIEAAASAAALLLLIAKEVFIGLVMGYLLSLLIDMVPFETEALPTITTYPIDYNPKFYLIGGVFGLVTTYLAGFFPARKAATVDPVEIIRGK
jgi:O-antigen/teichoic acid export membrane protein